MTIDFWIYASLAATLVIAIAMHHMKERWFVVWVHTLLFFWCGVAPGAAALWFAWPSLFWLAGAGN